MSRIRNIKELADLAGVSTGTVSRALAGSTLISLKTRERIQALAKEHGFRPNLLARNLRIQRTNTIGVLIPLGHETAQHLTDPFFITMLGLLADKLTERGYDLLLSRVIPTDSAWLDRIATSGRVDGLIVIGQSDQAATIDAVAKDYRPLVVWGGYDADQVHCSVGSDNRKGGDLAASHLIAQGCRKIAFFGDPKTREIEQRLQGVRDALARAGMGEPHIEPAHLTDDEFGPEIAGFLGQAADGPIGIVAASDVIALKTLRAMAVMGLSAPNDVRVMGYDGLTIGEHTVPQLSTICQDLVRGAEHLVDMLVRRIAGEDTQSVVMEPELVLRASA
ncbi:MULTISPECIES: LacI family DNA-binding transcriptional regulator [unclassified Novosphingobium]|uniref:LacI family DNA-binding transcriptional regulator n=1 Tax=unclassified Novosphingobium TaxID=2644732 RepID=UPI00086F4592|nr:MULTISPECIES: LacI family DNA-binding transcriptional regulator [unclassified Novosphingobium]MDR6709150.1 DNA-binding LacI/PurR family transcriptional regulator [Novosphingobium sp. 1748]NKJ01772.1 DNA-binding LacI/PurR family transcriptional regulator [Novosphingobium sp. SG707]ODU77301.1 MAG: LacI family transcriptional regulator [Novosphingobium sp. SCN 63-17]